MVTPYFLPWWHQVFAMVPPRFYRRPSLFWTVSKNMAPSWWQKLLNEICDYSINHHWHPTHPSAPPTCGCQKIPCKNTAADYLSSLLLLLMFSKVRRSEKCNTDTGLLCHLPKWQATTNLRWMHLGARETIILYTI
jgi:hypothetical protein